MEWLVIAILLLAAFGGIAYVMPSKFQRKVGQLRLEARKQGIQTSARTIPDLDAAPEDRVTSGGKVRQRTDLCVVYELGYVNPPDDPPQWQLVRYKKSQLPIPGWLLRDDELSGVQLSDARYWGSVAEQIADMPKICRSVASSEASVAWIGVESKSTVLDGQFLAELLPPLKALQDLNVRSSSDS